MALIEGIAQGFATGLGAGVANWRLIKRLEKLETHLIDSKNKKPGEPK